MVNPTPKDGKEEGEDLTTTTTTEEETPASAQKGDESIPSQNMGGTQNLALHGLLSFHNPSSPSKNKKVAGVKRVTGPLSATQSSSAEVDEISKSKRRRLIVCTVEGCEKGSLANGGKCKEHGGHRRCEKVGCTRDALTGGSCKQHGGGWRCTYTGCSKHALSGQRCSVHGGGPKCEHESGCEKAAQGPTRRCKVHGGGQRCDISGCHRTGVRMESGAVRCVSHGGERKYKQCTIKDCQNTAVSHGKCRTHGGGRRCDVAGCTKAAQGISHNKYRCVSHGGGQRCGHEGCTKLAQSKGKCVAHGGTIRRCAEPNCGKTARTGGRCVQHGGGLRCEEPGCPSSARPDGRCITHGGGKRCNNQDCSKAAQGSKGFCKKHGGGRICGLESCENPMVGASLRCKEHGGGKRCSILGCRMTARPGGKCVVHIGTVSTEGVSGEVGLADPGVAQATSVPPPPPTSIEGVVRL